MSIINRLTTFYYRAYMSCYQFAIWPLSSFARCYGEDLDGSNQEPSCCLRDVLTMDYLHPADEQAMSYQESVYRLLVFNASLFLLQMHFCSCVGPAVVTGSLGLLSALALSMSAVISYPIAGVADLMRSSGLFSSCEYRSHAGYQLAPS